MTHHTLKTWPSFFEAIWRGDKTFEVRIDDRGFQRGDTVTLAEWDRRDKCDCPMDRNAEHLDDCAKFSGRTVSARIGHVLASTPPRGSQRGFVGNGYVVFSLCEPERRDGRPALEAIERVHAAAAKVATP